MARTIVYRAVEGTWNRGGMLRIALQAGYMDGSDFVLLNTMTVDLEPSDAAAVFTGAPNAGLMRIVDLTAAVSAPLQAAGIIDSPLQP